MKAKFVLFDYGIIFAYVAHLLYQELPKKADGLGGLIFLILVYIFIRALTQLCDES